MTGQHKTLVIGPAHRLAYRQSGSMPPSVMFLGGFRSDMTGTKAEFLDRHCTERGLAFTRFDYRGHGASTGEFTSGSIGDWLEDALHVFDQVVAGPSILVGSSMGGWIMLLLALRRPNRVRGLIGIAAAPDFTESLIYAEFDEAQRRQLGTDGIVYRPSPYGDPDPITKRLIKDGRSHLLMDKAIPITCPCHLLHGQQDAEVPWRTALAICERIEGSDVAIELVKDGDHRLSRDQDLTRLALAVDRLAEQTKLQGDAG